MAVRTIGSADAVALIACRQAAMLCADLDMALREAKVGADGLTGMSDDTGGGGSGAKSSPQERYMMRLNHMEVRVRAARERYDREAARARGVIVRMPEEIARFAHLYYVEALEIMDVATAMGCNRKSCKRWRCEIEGAARADH